MSSTVKLERITQCLRFKVNRVQKIKNKKIAYQLLNKGKYVVHSLLYITLPLPITIQYDFILMEIGIVSGKPNILSYVLKVN